jgi:hypothetical protein
MVSPTEDEDLKTDPTDQQQQEDSSTPNPSDIENNAEDSSNSEKSEAEPSTFDVVMNAIDGDGDEDDKSESNSDEDEDDDSGKEPKGDKTDDDSEAEEDEFEDFTPEERANLKKATAERFDKLKGLYHKAKEEKETLTAQLEEATVDAGNYRQFTGYLEQNGITEPEANELFEIGALMKNDPAKALELIHPHYQQLLQVTGNILPEDLQQQVQQGFLTREHAIEISRSRAMNQTNQIITQEKQQRQQIQTQRQQQQEQTTAIQDGITNWESKWSKSDPDYNKKKDRVLDQVELMLARANREGKMPQTVDEAIKLAEDARKFVEKDLKQFMPKKSIQTVDGGSTVTTQPAPKDTADVIRRALNT